METRKYGCIPDDKDEKDLIYKVTAPVSVPDVIDLRPHFPAPYDQGQIGSCVFNALAGGVEYDQMKQNNVTLKTLTAKREQYFMPSRLFMYNLARKAAGTFNEDAGSQIRDGIKILADNGVCHESLFPYSDANLYKMPSNDCIKEALKYKAVKYERVLKLSDIFQCLAKGYPVTFGMQVFEEMESEEVAKTGIVPMPSNPNNILGGHGVISVGVIQSKKVVIVRNSWGPNFGNHGYFTLPFDYFEAYVDDMWAITFVNI